MIRSRTESGEAKNRAKAPLRVDLAGAWTDIPEFSAEIPGAVCSFTISSFVEGDGKTFTQDLPSEAGLGSSAARFVVAAFLEDRTSARDIALRAFLKERATGALCGLQDHLAAAYGGFNFFTFEGMDFDVFKMPFPHFIAEQSLLVFTHSRVSSEVHSKVYAEFNHRKHLLSDLEKATRAVFDAFRTSDQDEIISSLKEAWQIQKSFAPESLQGVEEVLTFLEKRALFAKVCGAGGGGFVFAIFSSGQKPEEIGLEVIERGLGEFFLLPRFEPVGVRYEP